MIVLDTNVLSELMREDGSMAVVQWVDRQPVDRLFTTAVTQAEILYGLEFMDRGKRRDARLAMADRLFSEDFAGRILVFDSAAAAYFARIAADWRRAGKPGGSLDSLIAAIARANGMAVATRNTRHFEDCGIDVINPWEA